MYEKQIANLHKETTQLKALRLSKIKMDDTQAGILSQHLMKNQTLAYLDVSYNQIHYFGAVEIFRMVAQKKNIKHLIIQGNKLSPRSCDEVAKNLKLSRLRCLDLRSNLIDDVGISKILDELEQKVHFEKFYFWGNQIGSLSAEKVKFSKFYSEDYDENVFDVKIYSTGSELCHARIKRDISPEECVFSKKVKNYIKFE